MSINFYYQHFSIQFNCASTIDFAMLNGHAVRQIKSKKNSVKKKKNQ